MSVTQDDLRALARSVAASNEQLSSYLASQNDAPNPHRADAVQGIADQGTQTGIPGAGRRLLSFAEKAEARRALRKLSDVELETFFYSQLAKRDSGIPLYNWLSAGGYSTQSLFSGINREVDPDIAKAIDSGGASALIRQDLEPVLYEIYVRQFPAYDRIGKEPANGLVHAYNQITSYGDAKFMAELGTTTDDQSTYVRRTTNVAILATRRGISLKSQFAVLAGGMNYNPEQLELQGGLRAMTHRFQTQLFSAQATASGGLYSNEYGAFDTNAFDGARFSLSSAYANYYTAPNNSASIPLVDPTTNPTTTGSIKNAIDSAIIPIIQNGGQPSIIWSFPTDKQTFDHQNDANVRYVAPDLVDIAPGTVAQRVNTIAGPLPWAIVPGDSTDPTTGAVGFTPFQGGATKVRDIFVFDEKALSIPFLGTEGPTVLDIPIGISGQLTRLFVIFQMGGLAFKSLLWQNAVQVKIS
jgi:hypothetical protein